MLFWYGRALRYEYILKVVIFFSFQEERKIFWYLFYYALYIRPSINVLQVCRWLLFDPQEIALSSNKPVSFFWNVSIYMSFEKRFYRSRNIRGWNPVFFFLSFLIALKYWHTKLFVYYCSELFIVNHYDKLRYKKQHQTHIYIIT